MLQMVNMNVRWMYNKYPTVKGALQKDVKNDTLYIVIVQIKF